MYLEAISHDTGWAYMYTELWNPGRQHNLPVETCAPATYVKEAT